MITVMELEVYVLRPLVFTMLAFGLVWFLWKTRSSKTLPGFKGLPLLGALPYLGKYKEKVLSKWSKLYGPIYQIKMGLKDVVVINSSELAYEAFAKNDCFNDRLQSIPRFVGGKGILQINQDDLYKEQRRFALNTLREFGMGRRSLEPRIIDLCHQLSSKIDALCGKDGVSSPFSLAQMFHHLTSSVISHIMFGHEVRCEDEELRRVMASLNVKSKTAFLDGIIFLSPFLRHFPMFSTRWRIGLDTNRKLQAAVAKEVKLHRLTRDPASPRDFVDCFLNQMETFKKLRKESQEKNIVNKKCNEIEESKQWENLSSFEEEQLVAVGRDLFLAGTDTTANALLWIVLFLCKYSEVQRKIQTEIDHVFGKEGFPRISRKDEVPYVLAVIQEVSRMRPIVPVLPHLAARDGILSGWKIKKGTLLFTNVWEIGTNESRWPEPDKFIPERHIDGDGKFFKHRDCMPFGVGTRSCLGQQLAQMELFITIIILFQKFNFVIGPGVFPDMRGDSGASLRPYPFKVIASHR